MILTGIATEHLSLGTALSKEVSRDFQNAKFFLMKQLGKLLTV